MKRFNHIFLYIIHSFYYMMGSILLFINVCDNILENRPNYNLVIVLSVFFYFIIFNLLNIYEKKEDIDLSESKKFIILNGIACILAGIASAFEQGFFMIAFTSAYFAIISIFALRTNRVNTSVYIKVAKSLALIIVSTSFYIADKTIIAFGNKVIDYILIYSAVIVFYVVCINFNEHFEGKNTINKNKNLFMFNFLVAAITTIFTFFKQGLLHLVKIFYDFIEPATDSLLEKISSSFTSFMERFFNSDFMLFVGDRINQLKEHFGIEQTPLPELPKEEVLEKVGEVADFSVIYNILQILLIAGIIFILYKSLGSYKHKKIKKKSFEEKEFIFKKDDFLNDLKNSFKNILRKKEILPKERLIYKKTVNRLIEEGYEISKITTPNEYINSISIEDINKYNFDIITSNYNAYRYGKDNT